MQLDYKDDVTIYAAGTVTDYGYTQRGALKRLKGKFVQTTGTLHSNSQDATTADAKLYLPSNNKFLRDLAYRIEGLVCRINLFDNEDEQQYFQIDSVTVARDILLNNQVRHIECDLTKITDFKDEC